jgi:hypothetical protein
MEQQLTAQVTFRIDSDTLKAAKKLAAKEERKLADVLRRLLVAALKEK